MFTEIKVRLRGGDGKSSVTPHEAEHEITLFSYAGGIVAQVGYHDGSDFPDHFTREQWIAFSDQVRMLFDTAEDLAQIN